MNPENEHPQNEAPKEAPSDFISTVKELVRFTVLSLIIIIPFRIFIAQPFVVSGASMDPTFKDGDYLIVDEISHRFEMPQRGEVIVFKYPKDPTKIFIKRVIGLPGETVEVKGTQVTIKNGEHPEGFTLSEPYIVRQGAFEITTTLAHDEYFVMGDNREGSLDSRIWGPLKENLIVGRPVVRLLPPGVFSFVPGDKSGSY